MATAVLIAACTIADVSIPASEDRLVVEAVPRTDARMQLVLLYHSSEGASDPEKEQRSRECHAFPAGAEDTARENSVDSVDSV